MKNLVWNILNSIIILFLALLVSASLVIGINGLNSPVQPPVNGPIDPPIDPTPPYVPPNQMDYLYSNGFISANSENALVAPATDYDRLSILFVKFLPFPLTYTIDIDINNIMNTYADITAFVGAFSFSDYDANQHFMTYQFNSPDFITFSIDIETISIVGYKFPHGT